MSDSKAEIEFEDKETLLRSALTFKEMGWEEESRAITRAVANLAEKNNEIATKEAELARLREALQRISDGTDAPDIDLSGDWQTGLYCGVEDRDCQDRYEGADYGYSQGVERTLEWAGNEADYALKEQQ